MATENKTTVTSGPFTLQWRDYVNGFIRAAIGAALTQIYSVADSLSSGLPFTFNWKLTLGMAVGAGLSDLVKRFRDPAKLVITKPTEETVQEVKNITKP